MGMAAGQARLLSITARLTDNELRAQTITNSKLRLATESTDASKEYMEALNSTQLMWGAYGSDGMLAYQSLTANTLLTFGDLKNQYSLVNPAGQIMVSGKDLKNYEASSTLNQFLKASGVEPMTNVDLTDLPNVLEAGTELLKQEFKCYGHAGVNGLIGNDKNWHTGYLAHAEHVLGAILWDDTNKGEQAIVVENKETGDLATITKYAEDDTRNTSSLTALTSYYEDATWDRSYSDLSKFLEDFEPVWEDGEQAKEEFSIVVAPDNETKHIDGYKWRLKDSAKSENETEEMYFYTTFIKADSENPTGVADISVIQGYKEENIEPIKAADATVTTKDKDGNEVTGNIFNGDSMYRLEGYGSNSFDYLGVLFDTPNAPYNSTSEDATLYAYFHVYQKTDASQSTGLTSGLNHSDTMNNKNGFDDKYNVKELLANDEELKTELQELYYKLLLEVNSNATAINGANVGGKVGYKDYSTGKIYDNTLAGGLGLTGGTIDNNELFEETSMEELIDEFLETMNDMVFKLVYDIYSSDDGRLQELAKIEGFEALDSAMTEYLYDTSDPKCRWYTNLWYRMGGGAKNADGTLNTGNYKELDENLINNPEWLQFALEHGVLTMEQVTFTENGSQDYPGMGTYDWQSIIHTNAADIRSQENETAIAKAEVKYKNAMNEIESQDKKYDQDLKKLDAEHTALQTEYESVKSVIDKNVERSFKAFS